MADIDEGSDVCFEGIRRAAGSSSDLLFGEKPSRMKAAKFVRLWCEFRERSIIADKLAG